MIKTIIGVFNYIGEFKVGDRVCSNKGSKGGTFVDIGGTEMNNKCNTCTVNIQVGCLANSDMEAANCSDYLESCESKLSEVFKMLEGEEQSGIQSARITEWLSANKELK